MYDMFILYMIYEFIYHIGLYYIGYICISYMVCIYHV